MERSVIDQSQLINEVLSLRHDFELVGPTARAMNEQDDYCLEDYQWLPAAHLTGFEELAATWQGMAWVGVKAA